MPLLPQITFCPQGQSRRPPIFLEVSRRSSGGGSSRDSCRLTAQTRSCYAVHRHGLITPSTDTASQTRAYSCVYLRSMMKPQFISMKQQVFGVQSQTRVPSPRLMPRLSESLLSGTNPTRQSELWQVLPLSCLLPLGGSWALCLLGPPAHSPCRPRGPRLLQKPGLSAWPGRRVTQPSAAGLGGGGAREKENKSEHCRVIQSAV